MTNAHERTQHLATLLRREHAAMADFLVELADFDARRLWRDLGHTSLFYFLHRELGLSKGAAHYRKVAAELVQRHPEVVEPLRTGQLCITSVVELAKVLTPENSGEVLPRFFHRSKREAREVAVELRPEVAPRREVVTAVGRRAAVGEGGGVSSASAAGGCARLQLALGAPSGEPAPTANASDGARTIPPRPMERHPVQAGDPARLVQPVEPLDRAQLVQPVEPNGPSARSTPLRRRDDVEPLTGDLRRLHVTVSRRFVEKLEAARDALSHAKPGASTAEVLEAALDALLAARARKRGLVQKPRTAPTAETAARAANDAMVTSPHPRTSRHVPAAVRRAVWLRDGGRCQFRLPSGGICGSTHRLELDHVVPWAQGGASTIDNLRVVCRGHNDLAARRAYGDLFVDAFTGGGRSAAAPRSSG